MCPVLQRLRELKVNFMVAPYEADAQLAFLSRDGTVAAVISEDSDLMAMYQCDILLTKIDFKTGMVEETGWKALQEGLSRTILAPLQGPGLRQRLMDVCILAGCDYLASLHGIGLKKACNLMVEHGSVFKVMPLPC